MQSNSKAKVNILGMTVSVTVTKEFHMNVSTADMHTRTAKCIEIVGTVINTLGTGDTNLRFYITTVQDGWCKSVFNTRLVSTHCTLNYTIIVSEFVIKFI
jgi:hypothetical protein